MKLSSTKIFSSYVCRETFALKYFNKCSIQWKLNPQTVHTAMWNYPVVKYLKQKLYNLWCITCRTVGGCAVKVYHAVTCTLRSQSSCNLDAHAIKVPEVCVASSPSWVEPRPLEGYPYRPLVWVWVLGWGGVRVGVNWFMYFTMKLPLYSLLMKLCSYVALNSEVF